MSLVWPDTSVVDDNLTQQISSLRKTLGDYSDEPTYILTIPRRGYRFLAPVRMVPTVLADAGSEASGNAAADSGKHAPAAVSSPVAAVSAPVLAEPNRITRHTGVPLRWTAGALVVAVLITGGGHARRPPSVADGDLRRRCASW